LTLYHYKKPGHKFSAILP